MSRLPKYKESDFPNPGSVFVVPLSDGRLAAGRVLRVQSSGGDMAALVAGSPWIGSSQPPLDLPVLREILVKTHHGWSERSLGGNRNCLWCVNLMPADFKIIGEIEPSASDLAIQCGSYGGWGSIPFQVELQWRWDHDRDNLLREEAEAEALEAERRRAVAERRAEFMRSLTLEKLAGTRWFQSWDEQRPTTQKSRERIAQLIHELLQVPKLTPGAVKKLLRAAVRDFNTLDKKNQFIDTIEREDLCEVFEQIACAARQPAVAGEIDEWRTW